MNRHRLVKELSIAILILSLLLISSLVVVALPPPPPKSPSPPGGTSEGSNDKSASNQSTGNQSVVEQPTGVQTKNNLLTLLSPKDGEEVTASTITFSFQVSSDLITDCFLLVDGDLVDEITINGEKVYNDEVKISTAQHRWSLSCEESDGSSVQSKSSTFKVSSSESTPQFPNRSSSSKDSSSKDESVQKTSDNVSDKGSSHTVLLIFIFLFVALIVGVGSLVYTKKLDIGVLESHFDALLGSSFFKRHARSSGDKSVKSLAEKRTLISYIFAERAKGYDDLTIRDAILRQGWKKEEVDGVFQELYQSKKN